MKKSIVKIHECLADEQTLRKQKDMQDYQSLLLKQYLSKINMELAHPFNYSLVKYRIKMMTKNKSKWWAKYKVIFAIPVIVFGLVAFANSEGNLQDRLGNNGNYMEEQPEGMIFIPQGSFIWKRFEKGKHYENSVSVEAFWMKQNEVTVKEYFEFVNDLKKEDDPIIKYEDALPDYSKAPVKNYFSSDKYKDYPIVGISWQQAKRYCAWKTNKEIEKLPGIQGHAYRLPVEAEWVYASFGGIQPDDIQKTKKYKLKETGSGKSNEWELYNMFDNVSEWTGGVIDPKYRVSPIIFEPVIDTPYFTAIEKRTGDTWVTIEFPRKQGTIYLDSLFYEKGQCIVKGNNFLNNAPDDKLILQNDEGYEYVGFRYVRSYLGGQ